MTVNVFSTKIVAKDIPDARSKAERAALERARDKSEPWGRASQRGSRERLWSSLLQGVLGREFFGRKISEGNLGGEKRDRSEFLERGGSRTEEMKKGFKF